MENQKERYPSFIYIDKNNDKLPKFTKEIVSGLELSRSKTIMGYEEQIKNVEKKDLPETLLKVNNPSAFTPIDGSEGSTGDNNCNLN